VRVVAIGMSDDVRRGHRRVLARLRELSGGGRKLRLWARPARKRPATADPRRAVGLRGARADASKRIRSGGRAPLLIHRSPAPDSGRRCEACCPAARSPPRAGRPGHGRSSRLATLGPSRAASAPVCSVCRRLSWPRQKPAARRTLDSRNARGARDANDEAPLGALCRRWHGVRAFRRSRQRALFSPGRPFPHRIRSRP